MPQEDKLITYVKNRFFNRVNNGVFIDVGANDGVYNTTTRGLSDIGWVGYCLEPNPYCFDRLNKNRPNCTNIMVGLSDKDDTLELTIPMYPHRNGAPGGSTINPLDELLNRWEGVELKVCEINVITYSNLIEKYNITNVDFMSIDVEGHEINVINGMLQSNVLPKVICIEIDKIDTNLLDKLLYDNGYVKDDNNISKQDWIYFKKSNYE